MATYERLDYGSSDGSQWGGSSSEPIGFYGATPSAQIGISTTISTISSSTEAIAAISSVMQALRTIGLFRAV
jgi:hypothetical protein